MKDPQETTPSGNPAPGWAAFCDRMKALGEKIARDDFPQSPRARAEGVRHLARMVSLGLTLHLEYDDPAFPRFLRHNDDVSQWGGNNPDNTYLFARIDAESSYRICGNTSNTAGFIVSVRDGFMHHGREAVNDLASAAMDIAADGSFEMIVSPDKHEGNWLQTIPGATQLGVRIYFDDWERQTLPTLYIERLGSEGQEPPPLTSGRVAAGLDAAGDWIETCVVYWNDFLRQRMPFLPLNQLSPPMQVPGGSNEVITYAGGRLDLDAGQALVLTIEPLRADYLGLVYYSEGWFETGDLANRLTSLNHKQLHADRDGRTRVVICASDPGTPNWIDTEDRRNALLTMRTLNAAVPPEVTGVVVSIDSLSEALPTDTKWMSASARRAQIAARRQHLAMRFHR